LKFDVWRSGRHIGRHTIILSVESGDLQAAIDAEIAVAIGPITLFRYRHQALESWRAGHFHSLTSQTVTNGRREHLTAIPGPDGVLIRGAKDEIRLPAGSVPLTHWNEQALASPLFNPQTGAPIRSKVTRLANQILREPNRPAIEATRYSLSGDTDLVDWYDASGAWRALMAKAQDGSQIDYRRAA
jgi:hypothetical protein